MIDLLKHIIKQLVDDPEKVEIVEKKENGVDVYYITVSTEDRGRIIGRDGRTINSLRALINAASVKAGSKAVVKIID